MTPDRLEELAVCGEIDTLIKEVAPLSDKDRRALSQTAQKLKKDVEGAGWEMIGNSYQPKLPERLQKYNPDWTNSEVRYDYGANLAVLAVCPISVTKKVHSRLWVHDGIDHGLQVLLDRKPDWIDEWVEAGLEGESPDINWSTLQGLMQAGVCKKPTSDGYYRAVASMLNGWSRWTQGKTVPLSEILANDPSLLDDVWKLFEVETDAFAYDWGEGRDAELESWPTAIYKLCQRGLLDRSRLLDATLSGLTTGFKQNVIGGFAKLHERLEPTPAEMAERQATYCDLMSVQLAKVVSFATKMLKKLDQKKKLSDEAFVASAGAVFNVTTKGPPKVVIALLKKITKRSPDLIPQLGRTLVAGLDHPAEDVQAAALDLLVEISEHLDEQAIDEIATRLEDLPATLQPRARELVTQSGGEVTEVADDAGIAERLAECKARLKEVDPRWRSLAGIDDALAAIDSENWPSPLNYEIMQVPVLTGKQQVEPIQSVEELIDAVAHAIEQVDSAIEVERILDGISRLCDQRPDDFDRRVAPLVKRIEKTRGSDRPAGIASAYVGVIELPKLLGVWLTGDVKLGEPPHGWPKGSSRSGVNEFIGTRLAALRQRVAAKEASSLLAMPTHELGWIAANAIVDRWRQIESNGSHPQRYEIIQALLRMAPDGREEALQAAGQLTHPLARPLRWALGGDEAPTKKEIKQAKDLDLWIAAGRARAPLGTLDELTKLKVRSDHPDVLLPTTYHWTAYVDEIESSHDKTTYRYEKLTITTEPAYIANLDKKGPGQPTSLLHWHPSKEFRFEWRPYIANAPWMYDWISMSWLHNLNPFLAAGCHCLMFRLDETSSTWEPNHAFLPPLFDADRPWSNITHLVAILGVCGRDQDVRGLAVDALVEGIADGRIHPKALGETLATLSTPYWLKLNRVCDNFGEIARVSPLHAWTIALTLHALLSAYEDLPRDAHHLLALLQELHAQLGISLPGEIKNKLEKIKGGSKTAKLAKALFQLDSQQLTPTGEEVRVHILEARIDRGLRWSGIG